VVNLLSEKMSEEEIQKWADYARRVLHPTPEEKAELEAKCRKLDEQFKRRTVERKRRIREQYAMSLQQQRYKFLIEEL
jgi:hypothetical protein